MKRFIYILVFLLSIINPVSAADIWPGVIGHGTGWTLNDAPGSGSPILCVIDDLNASETPSGDCLEVDYNGTGQTVCAGNASYCFGLVNEDGSGNPNGKVVLGTISGYVYNSSGAYLYLEGSDWAIIDLNPPGLTGNGLAFKNIKLTAFDTDLGDEELTHLFLKDFRSFHGSGRNEADGSPGNDTKTGMSNRKSGAIYCPRAGNVLEDIVIYRGTFAWSLDGPLDFGGFNSPAAINAKRITLAESIITGCISYDALEAWSSGSVNYPYNKWARVSYPGTNDYFESKGNGNNHEPQISGGLCDEDLYWRCIEEDMTDQSWDSWKGLTSYFIDGYSCIRNLFINNGQRNPLFGNITTGNVDNNLIYNARSLSTFLYNSSEDYIFKATISGNLLLEGPNASSSTYPTIWVYQAGWAGTVLESNTSCTSTGATSLCDTTKDWANDEWNGKAIRIVGGTGSGAMTDYGYITATNGATECVTISSAWTTTPDTNSDYEIVDLSDHDIYISDNKIIACTGNPCTSDIVTTQQDSLSDCGGNIYDWDCVDNRAELPEQHVKATSAPAGAYAAGYAPIDDDAVYATLLAQDGTGAGAYNDNQDALTLAFFNDVKNRTNVTAWKEYVLDTNASEWPTISTTAADILNIPTDMWSLCSDGNYRLVYWLQNDGDMSACAGGGGDITPPVIFDKQPSMAQACTTDPRNVTISCSTDESATCKYDTVDTTYNLMSNTFSTTGGTSHSQVVSLACEADYLYYVRCTDGSGNKNASSEQISFHVGTVAPSGGGAALMM